MGFRPYQQVARKEIAMDQAHFAGIWFGEDLIHVRNFGRIPHDVLPQIAAGGDKPAPQKCSQKGMPIPRGQGAEAILIK
jgi:hypothetical protein